MRLKAGKAGAARVQPELSRVRLPEIDELAEEQEADQGRGAGELRFGVEVDIKNPPPDEAGGGVIDWGWRGDYSSPLTVSQPATSLLCIPALARIA